MASEYLMKKYKDVKPFEPVQLTEKQKRRNWWEYHKIYFLIGALVLAAAVGFAWDMMSRVDPDYQIAFIGQRGLDEATSNLIAERLQPMLSDRDGDGKVIVQVNSYGLDPADPYAYTAQMALSNDVMLGNSSVYIMEDPMEVQRQFGMFYQTDGTLPEDDAVELDCAGFAWKDCPLLADIDLSGEYYIAHRGWFDADQKDRNAGTEALWDVMTGKTSQ